MQREARRASIEPVIRQEKVSKWAHRSTGRKSGGLILTYMSNGRAASQFHDEEAGLLAQLLTENAKLRHRAITIALEIAELTEKRAR